jgi:hypothetical protein
MDNSQNCDSYINIASSQSYWSNVKDEISFLWNINKERNISLSCDLCNEIFSDDLPHHFVLADHQRRVGPVAVKATNPLLYL